MKVRTIRKHGNAYPPRYRKNIGRKYEVSERDGANLVAAGLVVGDYPEAYHHDEADGED